MLEFSENFLNVFENLCLVTVGRFFVLAYILAKVEAGKDKEVFEEIRKLKGVKKASTTYGTYDLHIEAQFDTVEELDAFVFEKVRRIPGVIETVTMIASRTSA